MKEKVAGVEASIRVVDAVDVEEPGVALLRLPDGRLNGHLVTNLPAVPRRSCSADDDALAVGQPRLQLFLRNTRFGVELEVRRIDGHHRKLGRLVLVHAAEPCRVPDVRHAFSVADAIRVGDRQQLNEADLVHQHETIDARHLDAHRKRVLHDHQKAVEHERDEHRRQREDRPHLAPEQIAPDEREVLHATASISSPFSRCST
jgi:hypothetical protein